MSLRDGTENVCRESDWIPVCGRCVGVRINMVVSVCVCGRACAVCWWLMYRPGGQTLEAALVKNLSVIDRGEPKEVQIATLSGCACVSMCFCVYIKCIQPLGYSRKTSQERNMCVRREVQHEATLPSSGCSPPSPPKETSMLWKTLCCSNNMRPTSVLWRFEILKNIKRFLAFSQNSWVAYQARRDASWNLSGVWLGALQSLDRKKKGEV